ncbi:hypothetical protein DIPPA_16768 [Diplonema papillatum]|nr:hypothetical protein DIPPA_16768 [Diplonema papillatum]
MQTLPPVRRLTRAGILDRGTTFEENWAVDRLAYYRYSDVRACLEKAARAEGEEPKTRLAVLCANAAAWTEGTPRGSHGSHGPQAQSVARLKNPRASDAERPGSTPASRPTKAYQCQKRRGSVPRVPGLTRRSTVLNGRATDEGNDLDDLLDDSRDGGGGATSDGGAQACAGDGPASTTDRAKGRSGRTNNRDDGGDAMRDPGSTTDTAKRQGVRTDSNRDDCGGAIGDGGAQGAGDRPPGSTTDKAKGQGVRTDNNRGNRGRAIGDYTHGGDHGQPGPATDSAKGQGVRAGNRRDSFSPGKQSDAATAGDPSHTDWQPSVESPDPGLERERRQKIAGGTIGFQAMKEAVLFVFEGCEAPRFSRVVVALSWQLAPQVLALCRRAEASCRRLFEARWLAPRPPPLPSSHGTPAYRPCLKPAAADVSGALPGSCEQQEQQPHFCFGRHTARGGYAQEPTEESGPGYGPARRSFEEAPGHVSAAPAGRLDPSADASCFLEELLFSWKTTLPPLDRLATLLRYCEEMDRVDAPQPASDSQRKEACAARGPGGFPLDGLVPFNPDVCPGSGSMTRRMPDLPVAALQRWLDGNAEAEDRLFDAFAVACGFLSCEAPTPPNSAADADQTGVAAARCRSGAPATPQERREAEQQPTVQTASPSKREAERAAPYCSSRVPTTCEEQREAERQSSVQTASSQGEREAGTSALYRSSRVPTTCEGQREAERQSSVQTASSQGEREAGTSALYRSPRVPTPCEGQREAGCSDSAPRPSVARVSCEDGAGRKSGEVAASAGRDALVEFHRRHPCCLDFLHGLAALNLSYCTEALSAGLLPSLRGAPATTRSSQAVKLWCLATVLPLSLTPPATPASSSSSSSGASNSSESGAPGTQAESQPAEEREETGAVLVEDLCLPDEDPEARSVYSVGPLSHAAGSTTSAWQSQCASAPVVEVVEVSSTQHCQAKVACHASKEVGHGAGVGLGKGPGGVGTRAVFVRMGKAASAEAKPPPGEAWADWAGSGREAGVAPVPPHETGSARAQSNRGHPAADSPGCPPTICFRVVTGGGAAPSPVREWEPFPDRTSPACTPGNPAGPPAAIPPTAEGAVAPPAKAEEGRAATCRAARPYDVIPAFTRTSPRQRPASRPQLHFPSSENGTEVSPRGLAPGSPKKAGCATSDWALLSSPSSPERPAVAHRRGFSNGPSAEGYCEDPDGLELDLPVPGGAKIGGTRSTPEEIVVEERAGGVRAACAEEIASDAKPRHTAGWGKRTPSGREEEEGYTEPAPMATAPGREEARRAPAAAGGPTKGGGGVAEVHGLLVASPACGLLSPSQSVLALCGSPLPASPSGPPPHAPADAAIVWARTRRIRAGSRPPQPAAAERQAGVGLPAASAASDEDPDPDFLEDARRPDGHSAMPPSPETTRDRAKQRAEDVPQHPRAVCLASAPRLFLQSPPAQAAGPRAVRRHGCEMELVECNSSGPDQFPRPQGHQQAKQTPAAERGGGHLPEERPASCVDPSEQPRGACGSLTALADRRRREHGPPRGNTDAAGGGARVGTRPSSPEPSEPEDGRPAAAACAHPSGVDLAAWCSAGPTALDDQELPRESTEGARAGKRPSSPVPSEPEDGRPAAAACAHPSGGMELAAWCSAGSAALADRCRRELPRESTEGALVGKRPSSPGPSEPEEAGEAPTTASDESPVPDFVDGLPGTGPASPRSLGSAEPCSEAKAQRPRGVCLTSAARLSPPRRLAAVARTRASEERGTGVEVVACASSTSSADRRQEHASSHVAGGGARAGKRPSSPQPSEPEDGRPAAAACVHPSGGMALAAWRSASSTALADQEHAAARGCGLPWESTEGARAGKRPSSPQPSEPEDDRPAAAACVHPSGVDLVAWRSTSPAALTDNRRQEHAAARGCGLPQESTARAKERRPDAEPASPPKRERSEQEVLRGGGKKRRGEDKGPLRDDAPRSCTSAHDEITRKASGQSPVFGRDAVVASVSSEQSPTPDFADGLEEDGLAASAESRTPAGTPASDESPDPDSFEEAEHGARPRPRARVMLRVEIGAVHPPAVCLTSARRLPPRETPARPSPHHRFRRAGSSENVAEPEFAEAALLGSGAGRSSKQPGLNGLATAREKSLARHGESSFVIHSASEEDVIHAEDGRPLAEDDKASSFVIRERGRKVTR